MPDKLSADGMRQFLILMSGLALWMAMILFAVIPLLRWVAERHQEGGKL